MNHLNHLQYLAGKFEIQKYLVSKKSHGTIEQDAKDIAQKFGWSYQTCKRIVKHCVRMQWWKPADPISGAIRELWSMRRKVELPLLRLNAYDRRYHRKVSLIKPIKINADAYTFEFPINTAR